MWLSSKPTHPEPFLWSTFKRPTLHPGNLRAHTSPLWSSRRTTSTFWVFLGIRRMKPRSSTYTVRCFTTPSPTSSLFLVHLLTPLIYKNRRVHATGFSNVHWNEVPDDAQPYGELLQRDRRKLRFLCVVQLSQFLNNPSYLRTEFAFIPNDGSVIYVRLPRRPKCSLTCQRV